LVTTFKIYFPRVDLTETATLPQPQLAPEGGTEAIMRVEDDVDIRELVATVPEGAGYKVLKPDTATAGLELAQDTSVNFDLLLPDIIMRHMSGVELYDHVRRLRSGIKRLYMTVCAGNDLGRRGLLEPDMVVLEKPFDTTSLLTKFERCWTAIFRESGDE
jgi:two-component system, cell cycle sensor histidine kinase and response regulator CckA